MSIFWGATLFLATSSLAHTLLSAPGQLGAHLVTSSVSARPIWFFHFHGNLSDTPHRGWHSIFVLLLTELRVTAQKIHQRREFSSSTALCQPKQAPERMTLIICSSYWRSCVALLRENRGENTLSCPTCRLSSLHNLSSELNWYNILPPDIRQRASGTV